MSDPQSSTTRNGRITGLPTPKSRIDRELDGEVVEEVLDLEIHLTLLQKPDTRAREMQSALFPMLGYVDMNSSYGRLSSFMSFCE